MTVSSRSQLGWIPQPCRPVGRLLLSDLITRSALGNLEAALKRGDLDPAFDLMVLALLRA